MIGRQEYPQSLGYFVVVVDGFGFGFVSFCKLSTFEWCSSGEEESLVHFK